MSYLLIANGMRHHVKWDFCSLKKELRSSCLTCTVLLLYQVSYCLWKRLQDFKQVSSEFHECIEIIQTVYTSISDMYFQPCR